MHQKFKNVARPFGAVSLCVLGTVGFIFKDKLISSLEPTFTSHNQLLNEKLVGERAIVKSDAVSQDVLENEMSKKDVLETKEMTAVAIMQNLTGESDEILKLTPIKQKENTLIMSTLVKVNPGEVKPDVTQDLTEAQVRSPASQSVDYNEKKIENGTSKRHFAFSTGLSNTYFSATDIINGGTKASLATKVNLDARAGYIQHLTATKHLGVGVDYSQKEFTPIDTRALGKAKQSYLGYNVNFEHFGASSSLRLSVGVQDSPVVKGSGGGLIEIDRFSRPYLSVGTRMGIAQLNGFNLFSTIDAVLLIPSNSGLYSSKLSYGLKTKFYSEDSVQNSPNAYFLALGADYQKQTYSIVKQNYYEIGVEFGFRWGASR